jgi:DNA-directed RNA polymerase subunit RPC12/RpoP
MGHKKMCLECKKTFNREFDTGSGHDYKCPDCGKSMILMPHRFRPPKRTDDKKWETVKLLVENGFKYQHIYDHKEIDGKWTSESVEYPENPKDAKEFIKKYKTQSFNK